MTFSKMQSNFTYFSHIISLLYICLNQKRYFVGYCAIFRRISSIITIFLLLIRFLTAFFFPEKPFSAVKNRQISESPIFLWSNCTFPKARTYPAFSVDTHSVVSKSPLSPLLSAPCALLKIPQTMYMPPQRRICLFYR